MALARTPAPFVGLVVMSEFIHVLTEGDVAMLEMAARPGVLYDTDYDPADNEEGA